MRRCGPLLLLLAWAATALGQAPAPADGAAVCAETLWKRAEDIELPPVDGESEEQPPSKIVYNEAVEFAGGSMRVYARMTGPCEPPAAIGLEMSANLQDNLPGPDGVSMKPPPECAADPTISGCFMPFQPFFMPAFEQEAPEWNPFPLLEIDWSPVGHDPPQVYGTPHWDLHFYLVPEEEVKAIAPGGPCRGMSPELFAKGNQPIPEQCFPGEGFANSNGLVPLMGNHYVDMDSPEMAALGAGVNPVASWNSTWIWGGFDGKLTFFELMAKRSFLSGSPSLCSPIPGMPKEFAIPGYKPSTFCVITTDNATLVELRDFTWYDAGCTSGAPAPASFLFVPPGSPPLPPECIAPKPEGMAPTVAAAAGPSPTPAPAPAPGSSAGQRWRASLATLLLMAAAAAMLAM